MNSAFIWLRWENRGIEDLRLKIEKLVKLTPGPSLHLKRGEIKNIAKENGCLSDPAIAGLFSGRISKRVRCEAEGIFNRFFVGKAKRILRMTGFFFFPDSA
ncbi:MAG: hypothetical protein Q7J16_10625 [Candidatus Cloacimonadales bacterium]|nr:hypothetical protein [Candidatus Cloacimonadales bacterium]